MAKGKHKKHHKLTVKGAHLGMKHKVKKAKKKGGKKKR